MSQGNDQRCPFCGRRQAVRHIEADQYHCDHCRRLFRLPLRRNAGPGRTTRC